MKSSNQIFNLIKIKDFKKLKDLIKKNNVNFDIQDDQFNYPIQYLIKYNEVETIDILLKKIKLRLDILDTDGRNLLYIPIKYKYNEILKIILKYNKNNIGFNIIDRKDKLGFTGLHYSCILNNYDAFKILLDEGSDPYIVDNDNSNIFEIAYEYERNDILILLFKKIKDFNFLNKDGKNLLQLALERENNFIVDYLIKNNIDININNQDSLYGSTSLQIATILNNNDLIKKLVNKGGDINIQDFLGNNCIHYSIIENNINLTIELIDMCDNYNVENMDGNTILHLFLEKVNINISSENYNNSKEFKLLIKLIKNTSLNIQNNNGETCLHLLVKKYLWNDKYISEFLKNKELNIFIQNNNNEDVYSLILNKDNLFDIISNSYYNILLKNKDKIKNDKICILKDMKNKESCIEKIKKYILKNKISIPRYRDEKLKLDYGVFVSTCYYTGNNLDTLFGLIWLKNKYNNLKLVIDYPLTINNKLEEYYKKIGININWKIDFSNIQIMWSYQKIIFPTYFDNFFKDFDIKKYNFIIIPVGIDISNEKNYSHANILIWDTKKNRIERFEPHGANHPINFNYNSELLDRLLENKFKQINESIEYVKAKDYLPIISFEILENLEDDKCKRIGDPNGFCNLWCIWWCNQKIKYPNIDSTELCNKLIKTIKMDGKKFKNIIRNFSKNITDFRDNYLKKYKIDINDWIVNNYDDKIINNLEKDILELIN